MIVHPNFFRWTHILEDEETISNIKIGGVASEKQLFVCRVYVRIAAFQCLCHGDLGRTVVAL